MARIKNTSKILIKETPADTDLILGSDMNSNGKTVNFYVGSVRGSSGTSSADNLPKVINFGSALTGDIADAINSIGTPVTVAEGEIALFVGTETPSADSDVAYSVVYVLEGKGAGTYGVGGSMTVLESDLINIKFSLINNTDVIDSDPNSVIFDIGEIGEDSLLDTLNTYAPAFTILEGQNAYFEFTRGGDRFLYGFSGVYGVYGNGQNQFLLSELFLVFNGTTQPVVTRTSDIINNGSDATSTYVEADELGAAAFSNDYEDLSNKPTNTVLKSDYNANTVLAATVDDTPAALTINEQTLLGRITGGNITGLTVSQVRSLLAYLEEFFEGTATYNGSTTGSSNLDISAFSTHYAILTGNTTHTLTGLPASGKSVVKTLYVRSNTVQTYAIANSDFEVGVFVNDGTLNRITIEATVFPTIGQVITVTYENLI